MGQGDERPRSGNHSLWICRPLLCHPERSRGTCGAPEPQTKAPTSEFAGVAQTVVAWERGCPQFATPGVGTNGRTVERLFVSSER